MSRNLLHFHLPKTGGTALRHFFVDQLGEDRVSPPIAGVKLQDALMQWPHRQVISGHFAVSQGDILPADRYSVTALRDPIDRFLSELFFRKHDNASRLIETSLHTADLDSYITYCRNTQPEGPRVQLAMLFPLGAEPSATTSVDEKVQAAKRAVDLFSAVGIQEELEDFAAMLSAQFRWGNKPLARVNATTRRIAPDLLTAGQRRAMLDMLEPEIDLYRYALARFRQDRRRYICAPSDALDSSSASSSTVDPQDSASLVKTASSPLDFGNLRCELTSLEVRGEISGTANPLAGERMNVIVRFTVHEAVEKLNIGIAIKDERGVVAYGTNSQLLGHNFSVSPGAYEVTFSMLNRLGCGYYDVDAALVSSLSHFEGCYHWRERMAKFEVPGLAVTHFEGRVMMDAAVTLEGLNANAVWTSSMIIPEGASAGAFGRINPVLTDFNAIIVPMAKFETAAAALDVLLPARVSNLGSSNWPNSGRNPVRLSYRWLTREGAVEIADGLRTALPTDMSPAEETIVAMHLYTPSKPGLYSLVVSLVQEQNAWFIDHNPHSGFSLPVDIHS
jgi:Wzt C-terminal domain